MRESNLKPRRQPLRDNIEQYCQAQGVQKGTVEHDLLTTVCEIADKAIRIVTKIALEHVPPELKKNLFPQLTVGLETSSPMATEIGEGDAYRISIPTSFVHRLIKVAPIRLGVSSPSVDDYFIQSILVAVLAAYAHELNHIFIGHLKTPSSLLQEMNSDHHAGAMTWKWLRRDDIKKLLGVTDFYKAEAACAYGFLHLVSVLQDANNVDCIYPPRILRLMLFGGGATFYADQLIGKAQGDLVKQAMEALPDCPDPSFASDHIQNQNEVIRNQLSEDLLKEFSKTSQELQTVKQSWYDQSKHLQPIKKDLRKSLQRRGN